MRAISLLVLIIATTSVFGGQDCSDLIASFNTPPRSCTQVPFWFWNGPLDPDELASQLHEMAAKGVYGAMPHPRFEKIIRAFLKKTNEPVSAYKNWGTISTDGSSVSGRVPAGSWSCLVFFQCLGRNPSPLDHGSNSMTDYLSQESVKRFISLTHEEYRKRYGDLFGTVIPGLFTDEASSTTPGPFPWTEAFPNAFKKLTNTDIAADLPALLDPDSERSTAVRLAYWRTVTDLFHNGFLNTSARWCSDHSLAFTGHIYEENIRHYAHAPQLIQLLRPMDMPGFDALGPYCEPYGAKTAISAAHLYGRPRAMCECLGLAGGWNCTPALLRRGYNMLGALGVSFSTILSTPFFTIAGIWMSLTTLFSTAPKCLPKMAVRFSASELKHSGFSWCRL